MITPYDLKVSYKEFLNIVETQEQLALKEWKSDKIEDRCPCINMWINIDKNLVEDSYISMLKESYEKLGWSKVETQFQYCDRTGLYKLYICLWL